jgi:hypothetical protein
MELVEEEQMKQAKRPREEEASEEKEAAHDATTLQGEPAQKKIRSGDDSASQSQSLSASESHPQEILKESNFHFNEERVEGEDEAAKAKPMKVEAAVEAKENAEAGPKPVRALEAEVGITVLLGSSAPWIGIVKHRCVCSVCGRGR